MKYKSFFDWWRKTQPFNRTNATTEEIALLAWDACVNSFPVETWKNVNDEKPDDYSLIAVCKAGDWGAKLAYYRIIDHDIIFSDGDNLWCYMPTPPKSGDMNVK